MSKSLFSKILILLTLTLALVCTMSIVAFGEETENFDSSTEENQLVYDTEYGTFIVSDKYASVADYPWVSFDIDTGACLLGSKIFAQNSGSILSHNAYKSSNVNILVILRADFTDTSSSQWHNTSSLAGKNIVIDLQRNTFTMQHAMSNGLLYGEAKVSGTVGLTFQNGNILYKTTKVFLNSMPGDLKDLAYDITFKEINFKVDDSVASSSFTLFQGTNNNAGEIIKSNFVFIDSTLDFSNLAPSVTLFQMGSTKNNIDVSVAFKGGNIKGDVSKFFVYNSTILNPVRFLKNDLDQYPTVTLPSDQPTPTRVFATEENAYVSFKAENSVVDTDGNIQYTPVIVNSACQYGILPDDSALLTVFNVNTQEMVYSGNIFSSTDTNSALGAMNFAGGIYAIYFRDDIPASSTTGSVWDISGVSNTIILEMNNHHLQMNNSTLFRVQAKSTNSTQNIIMRNGFVNTNGQHLVAIGASTNNKNQRINVTFDNVDITVPRGTLVIDNVESDNANTYNVTFNDCDIFIEKNYSSKLFNIGNFSTTVTNLTVNGGSFTFADATLPSLTQLNGKSNVSFTMSFGSDGKFPTITTGETDEEEYVTDAVAPYGVYAFVNSVSENGTSTWVVYEKTQYGYIDEAHLDRVAYPMVMFMEGKPFDTWYPTNYGNEVTGTMIQEYFRANGKYANKNATLLVRSNCTFSGTLNHWTTICNFTMDFGGNTVTLSSSMLFHIDPRQAGTGNILVKNGTLKVNGKNVITHGFREAYTANITFENINFVSPNVIVGATSGGSTPYSTDLTFNIVFNNCSFSKSSRIYLFQFSQANSYPTVNIQVNGGTFDFANDYLMLSTANAEKIKLSFGSYNGEYTNIQVKNSVDLSSKVELDSNGMPLQFVKKSVVDTKVSYTLTPFSFVSTYLNLTHDINFVYRVCLPTGYTDPKATFYIGVDPIIVDTYEVDSKGLYCFKLTAIAPHKMGDCVTAVITATYNGEEQTVTNDDVSVKNYADALRAEYAQDTAMLDLLNKLLVYGAASQVYMNYKTDALVAEIGELSEVAKAPITLSGEVSDVANISTCGLLLDGAFDLRVGIQATSLEGLTLDITKGDATITVTLTEEMVDGDYIVAYYDGLYINELDTEVTFTLKQNGEVIGRTLTFSANAYLYRMQTSDKLALANLVKALYAYGNSAKAYNS